MGGFEERTRAREIRIEIKTCRNRSSGRRVLGISRQQTEDVIAPSMPCLDHQAQIRGQGAIVRRPGRLVILVWFGDVI